MIASAKSVKLLGFQIDDGVNFDLQNLSRLRSFKNLPTKNPLVKALLVNFNKKWNKSRKEPENFTTMVSEATTESSRENAEKLTMVVKRL